MQILKHDALSANVRLSDLTFKSTQELLKQSDGNQPQSHGWIAQAEAKKAAMFGLQMRQAGFNVLVLGQHGTGRTSLMQSAMTQVAKSAENAAQPLTDLVALFNFEQTSQPTLIKLPVGIGAKLLVAMDEFILALMGELPNLVALKDAQQIVNKASEWLPAAMENVSQLAEENTLLKPYIDGVKSDILTCLKAWQMPANNDIESALEGLIGDGFLTRFRVNLLVDNRHVRKQGLKQAVVYDNDPTYQSLFGSLESASDQMPDFLRLRAGNLHKADGGMLQIQLRDLLNDEQNGGQIIEKLYRFLRNGTLQFEDAASGTQSAGYVLSNTLIPLNVKLVLIAMREDFYSLLEETPDFFDYFPI
ncbi:MAG: AAA family ATPase, partial [Alphaproteobacteria bacterium]|nr:AAA family ATPase [Alphaproteobacteria bacterium]